MVVKDWSNDDTEPGDDGRLQSGNPPHHQYEKRAGAALRTSSARLILSRERLLPIVQSPSLHRLLHTNVVELRQLLEEARKSVDVQQLIRADPTPLRGDDV